MVRILTEKQKEERKIYLKKWYSENREYAKALTAKNSNDRRKRYRVLIREIKRERKCFYCGQGNPLCLEFHHLDKETKEFAIFDVIQRLYSLDRFVEEVDKCIVICCNCHLKLHDQERKQSSGV